MFAHNKKTKLIAAEPASGKPRKYDVGRCFKRCQADCFARRGADIGKSSGTPKPGCGARGACVDGNGIELEVFAAAVAAVGGVELALGVLAKPLAALALTVGAAIFAASSLSLF